MSPEGLDKFLWAWVAPSATAIACLWAGFYLIGAVARQLRERMLGLGRSSAAAAMPLLAKIFKVLWFALVLLVFLTNRGLNVSAVLAGLGVGGLAVALAGQKTIENLFGGVVLAFDQPVRVGDFCRFGDKLGLVEELGLRSIKIRTPERTLISVPNGAFSQLQIENMAVRDCIQFATTLRLRHDSPAPKLRDLIKRVESLLQAHAKVAATQGKHCRLVNLGEYSLDLEVLCYFATTDWDEYMLLRQDLFLELLDTLPQAGLALAYPIEARVQEKPLL